VLKLVATCAKGLEGLLRAEIGRGHEGVGAVTFEGSWEDVDHFNLWLRTANRLLVEVGGWRASKPEDLYQGAFRTTLKTDWMHPGQSFSLHATSSASNLVGSKVMLTVKDAIVDAQRKKYGERANIDRDNPDLPLRLRLHRNRATLLLDTSYEALDRRGYRKVSTEAPCRENLAAAMVLFAEPHPDTDLVVDPMCGSGTLLAEAASILGRLPSQRLRFDLTGPMPDHLRLIGGDIDRQAIAASRGNLEVAGFENARVAVRDAWTWDPPKGPGLLLINPPYGQRLKEAGDLDALLDRYRGYTAVLLLPQEMRLNHRPRKSLLVNNGPLEARIAVFDL
jgi:putative N6-adenine-specific DNA methylase